jgi:hypothetical protein
MKRLLIAAALVAATVSSCRSSGQEKEDKQDQAGTTAQAGPEEPSKAQATPDGEEKGEGNAESPPEDFIYTQEEPLAHSFFLPGRRFFRGCRETLGFPVEAFLKLVVVEDGKKKLLPKTGDLKGHVKIDSPEKALEFVRLFTDLETHYLFEDSRCIEVRPTDSGVPGYGELPRPEFERWKLVLPVTARIGAGFQVTRAVVDSQSTISMRTEQVSEDGNYLILKEIEVTKEADILFPMYE